MSIEIKALLHTITKEPQEVPYMFSFTTYAKTCECKHIGTSCGNMAIM